MQLTNYIIVTCFTLLTIIQLSQPTCVLESDFGFKINCAFKKAGLFRVRNLGGIKAHASLGFSLGDELGFEQSLTNLDPSRRRSVSIKNGPPPNLIAGTSSRPAAKQEKRGKQNRIMMRPQMPPSSRPNQSAMDTLTSLHKRGTSTMQPIIVVSPTIDTPTTMTRMNPVPKITMAKPIPMGLPAFKPLPPKEDNLKVLPLTSTKRTYTPLQIPQSKGPGIAYQSEHNYPRISQDQISKMVSQMTATHMSQLPQHQNNFVRITPHPIIVENFTPRVTISSPVPIFHGIQTSVNPFVPMPVAAPPTQAAISIIPGPVFKDSVQIPLAPIMMSKTPTAYSLAQNTMTIHKTPTPDNSPNPFSNFVDPVPVHINDLANQLYPVYNTKKVDDYNTITGYGDDTSLKINKDEINEKIAEIAKAGNISMEAVEAAIALRQQQLLNKFANIPLPYSSTTTTTTTTTEAPLVFNPEPEEIRVPVTPKQKRSFINFSYPTTGKVMNAPREYYPIGYEKNFDDQFQSKVDLPDTTFHCGDQKYFPGLYGDENLGCMVFHVCALTDDGLVMKSFLCPESTLFDQTILKCNWWFYVDCKSTRKLYDTNIPVSKSYQLMKALTFFSSYKKEIQDDDGRSSNPEVMDGVKEAISILENHNNGATKTDIRSGIEIITSQPATRITDSNIYRITNDSKEMKYRSNRNFRNATRTTSRPARVSAKKEKVEKSSDLEASPSDTDAVTQRADTNFSQSSVETTSKETTSRQRLYRRRPFKTNIDSKDANSTEIKLVTVNADINYSQSSRESSSTENSSKEQLPRRRFQNKKNRTPSLNSTLENISEISKPNNNSVTEILPETHTDKIEIITGVSEVVNDILSKPEVTSQSKVIKENPADHVDNIEKLDRTLLTEESTRPVKRFYRSSAEINSKEMTFVNNEKVQIVRPKPYSRLVGEYPTPIATIAKLDDAILGTNNIRHKKEAGITIITPHKNKDSKDVLSST